MQDRRDADPATFGEEAAPRGATQPRGRWFEKRPTPGFAPPTDKPEFSDLVDRTQGPPPTKPEFNDLVYRGQPSGLRDPAAVQSRGLSNITAAPIQHVASKASAQQQGRVSPQATRNDRFGAAQQAPAQNDAMVQQTQGAGAVPKGSGTNAAGSALQEHNRIRLLDETEPSKPEKPKQTSWSPEAGKIIKKPDDQFAREKAAYEREKVACEKARKITTGNREENGRNKQTLKAWENYDRAIQMMEKAPEGRKVLDHLRNDKTRVFKVVMVNDPVKDSYMGTSIKSAAEGEHVDTGMKDEQGRNIHVIFLTKSALEKEALTPDGKINPDSEALEKVWHELYHASERHTSGGVDPLEVGTASPKDRLFPQAHERRAVRFENIIRARNGGTRMKDRYGGKYVRGPDGQTRIAGVIEVPDAQPPWFPVPKP